MITPQQASETWGTTITLEDQNKIDHLLRTQPSVHLDQKDYKTDISEIQQWYRRFGWDVIFTQKGVILCAPMGKQL